MFSFAAAKLQEFEKGKISRRQLIETLTLAVSGAAVAGNAAAERPASITIAAINHVSYSCPNFRQAADWYSKLFNLDQVGLKENEVRLPFGKVGEQPYNVTAKDVPLTFLACRTHDIKQNEAVNAAPSKTVGRINHLAFTIADFKLARVQTELQRFGIDEFRGASPNAIHIRDPFGYDVEISGLGNSALTDGA